MTTRERGKFVFAIFGGSAFTAIFIFGALTGIAEGNLMLAKYTGLLAVYWAVHFIFIFRHRASFNGKLDIRKHETKGTPSQIIDYSPWPMFGYITYGTTLALITGFAAYDLSPLQGTDNWVGTFIFTPLAIWFASLPAAYLFRTLHRGYLAFTPEGIQIQSWTRKVDIPWSSITSVAATYGKNAPRELAFPQTIIFTQDRTDESKYSTLIWRMNDRKTPNAPRIDYRKIDSDARLVHDFVLTQVERHTNFRRQPY